MINYKKLGNAVMATAFLLLCAGLPLFGEAASALGWRTDTSENRTLAAFPEVDSLAALEKFPKGFESWFTDHLFLKGRFVKLKSNIELKAFHELDSETVVLGREKPWLFYRADDGDPLQTYMHTNLFTEADMKAIADTFTDLKNTLAEHGIDFVLMIVPDKEKIYGSDYMPKSIRVQEGVNRTEQFTAYMSENYPELPLLYPAQAIKDAEQSFEGVESLYYKTDTHWNKAGAYVAADALLQLAAERQNLEYQLEKPQFVQYQMISGDLQRLAQLGTDYYSADYSFAAPINIEFSRYVPTENDVVCESAVRSGEGVLPLSLYVAGDSYRHNMAEYLMGHVEHSTIAFRYYLDLEDVYAQQPDVFVFELAERYLGLMTEIPGFNAEAMEWPANEQTNGQANEQANGQTNGQTNSQEKEQSASGQ